MRYLYIALLYLLLPLILLRMLWRSRRAPAYRRRLAERFGLFDVPEELSASPVIWVHAVSVGETLAAVPLIEALLRDWPGYQLVVTTTTPTGSEQVRAHFGDRVFHVYAPWDMPGAVCRFLGKVRPQLLLIMETELWPNMLHYSNAVGCRMLLANARMSERSARGYGRFGGLTRKMLQQLDAVACQSVADGERLRALGLPSQALQVTGSIKFDLELDAALRQQASQLRGALQGDQRPILLGSSTHPGEDELLLAALSKVKEHHPQALLLLVPRHPERFDDVYRLCAGEGFRVRRRSSHEDVSIEDDILLGDTMGELRLLSGVAAVAVIGGSFIEHGGQNVLEAAAWGIPVVSGPHMFNFAEITELLVSAGAMVRLQHTDELAPCLLQLLDEPVRREEMGAAGERVVAENRGARDRLLGRVGGILSGA
jgi:3-deoxy-D-manno-octulosonic-acid transferase